MRRPTLIALIVLFTLLVGAAIWQLQIANQDRGPYPGPTSPGELPSPSA
ncbi:MAG TPA: hypothetical protein VFC08_00875 [Actinomycetota bacterium]|nr:hypothetical protein [Actinomycetota bacterium]